MIKTKAKITKVRKRTSLPLAIFQITALSSVLVACQVKAVFAADEHGPRAGYIRSGGDYIAELMAGNPKELQLYLLNPQWLDIELTDSKLKAQLVSGKSKPVKLDCAIKGRSFNCGLEKEPAAGEQVEFEFIPSPKVKGANSSKFVYQWPLKHQTTGVAENIQK